MHRNEYAIVLVTQTVATEIVVLISTSREGIVISNQLHGDFVFQSMHQLLQDFFHCAGISFSLLLSLSGLALQGKDLRFILLGWTLQSLLPLPEKCRHLQHILRVFFHFEFQLREKEGAFLFDDPDFSFK